MNNIKNIGAPGSPARLQQIAEEAAATQAISQNKIRNLLALAKFVIDGYPRIDINHEDYRVQVYKAALDAMGDA